jgi:hypothetical protein
MISLKKSRCIKFTCDETISDADLGRCLTADGLYLYTTNSVGRGVSKLGSGLHGTLRSVAWNLLDDLAETFASHVNLWKKTWGCVLIPHTLVTT